jgi:hypothetical protein
MRRQDAEHVVGGAQHLDRGLGAEGVGHRVADPDGDLVVGLDLLLSRYDLFADELTD